jgi:hypothetical protein
MGSFTSRSRGRLIASTIATATLALATSGCLYFPSALWTATASGGTEQPWWCEGAVAITNAECSVFSAQLDVMLSIAPPVSDRR